jgi:hypothetical protein
MGGSTGSIGGYSIIGAGCGVGTATGAVVATGRTVAGGVAQPATRLAVATTASQERDLMRRPPS